MEKKRKQKVYFDTSIFIHFIERKIDKDTEYFLENVIKESEVVTSELSLAECLVKPIIDCNEKAKEKYKEYFKDTNNISMKKIDLEVLILASEIRSQNGKIKLPDAIHIATALKEKCDLVYTSDSGFNRSKKLKQVTSRPAIVTLEAQNATKQ